MPAPIVLLRVHLLLSPQPRRAAPTRCHWLYSRYILICVNRITLRRHTCIPETERKHVPGKHTQEAGGDLLRDGPGVLPTGRNIHALDPYRMPSPAAMERGLQIAESILQSHRDKDADGAYPETVAVSLWGLDAIKTKGESVGILLALVGARPMKEGTGRIVRFELLPLEELGRPRIDVLANMSGACAVSPLSPLISHPSRPCTCCKSRTTRLWCSVRTRVTDPTTRAQFLDSLCLFGLRRRHLPRQFRERGGAAGRPVSACGRGGRACGDELHPQARDGDDG